MAKQSLATIKNWFQTRMKPTQAQYWDVWDSFWHKDETIPVAKVQNLSSILNSKATTESVTNAMTAIGELSTALGDKVDKVDDLGLSQENFTTEHRTKLEGIDASISESVATLIESQNGVSYETHLIEETTNASETVESNWSVLPFREQVGQAKVTVTVRNLVSSQIKTLVSILSFDYSGSGTVDVQDPLLADSFMSLDVFVDAASKRLSATVSGMAVDAKRIFFSFERVVAAVRFTPINYGRLYNFYAANDPRGIAAPGWHLMSNAEWTLLRSTFGMTTAGGMLKETGEAHWDAPNTGATNELGFFAKGAGRRDASFDFYASFIDFRKKACYWCEHEEDGYVRDFYMDYNSSNLTLHDQGDSYKVSGLSVAAVKDSTGLADGQTGICVGNDGKVYRSICIAGLEIVPLLAETKFRTGEVIPVVTDDVAWRTMVSAATCAPGNNEANV